MSGWLRRGNVWTWDALPGVEVAPWIQPESQRSLWAAYYSGKMYRFIAPGKSSRDVRKATERHFECRVDL